MAAARDLASPSPGHSVRPAWRRSLFAKYTMLFGGVVSVVLLAAGSLQIWFAYGELDEFLIRLEREQAEAAAGKIAQFVTEIEDQVGWTVQLPWGPDTTDQHRFDAQRLLHQVPAITEVSLIDGTGREQVRVSRLAVDTVGSGLDFSADPMFTGALAGKVSFGPVYFRSESEPYMAIAVAGNRRSAGVSVAQVNLKFIWDVVSGIRVGTHGAAYVVDADGRLIAHPDIALVLRQTDLSGLPQVRAAREGQGDGALTRVEGGYDLNGTKVLSAWAPVDPLNWWVFVESPATEAYAPIRAALVRSGALLVVGLALAIFAALVLAGRMVVPIRALSEGARRIGEGDLRQRIDVRTGDELEDLADQFNQMGQRLGDLYDNLERVSQLKRYFSPQLAEMIVSSTDNILGESHRREITVVFCDIRGFTSFSASHDPEVVMQVLDAYFECLGRWARRAAATVGHFAGDGLMVFFNDPLPCPGHRLRAVAMAVAMQRDVGVLIEGWRERGFRLGFGIGIASGEATLGHIGSQEQFHYTAIGPVVNLASRLCDEAASGEILIDAGVREEIAPPAEIAGLGERELKGFPGAVPVFRLVRLGCAPEQLIGAEAP